MRTVWEIIYNRQMALHYTAPPVCEVIFSGSSNPVIILSENPIGQVTGLVLSGSGAFRLSWNAFAGAICYNVYYINGENLAVILAQCVTEPFFDLPPGLGPTKVIVTPITKDGEGPPSDPLDVPGGGGQVQTVSVEAVCPQTSRASFPGVFRISRGAETSGNLTVGFTLTGTAVNGIDYNLIATFATIPNGSSSVLVFLTPVEAALVINKTAVLTLNESPFYFVEAPTSASILFRPWLLRIANYGGAEPQFTPPADASNTDYCDWDGTWNFFDPGDPNDVWWYIDADGNQIQPQIGVNGKTMFFTQLSGPFNNPTPGTWQLAVYCLDLVAFEIKTVWEGIKQGGDITTPTGIYLWNTSGSDMRPFITIEQI